MGDRFYESQRGSNKAQKKAPRKLKADWIKEINELFVDSNVEGLDKCTMLTLEHLYNSIIKEFCENEV